MMTSLLAIGQYQALLFDQELIRMTFIIGIMTSVMLYEKTHTTTGSIVVPGYIGAQLLNPITLVVTAVNATITWVLVSRVLPKYAVVFGRARFVVNIFTSVVISLLIGQSLSFVLPSSVPTLESIGYAIPALIAYDMNRQGVKKTAVAVSSAGVIAATPALLLVALLPGIVEAPLPVPSGLLSVNDVWFPIAAMVSTGSSTMLQANHRLRCGGFIGAMYLGLAAVDPIQIVFFVVVALLTYVLVAVVLRQAMIIFGRRKFAVMLMAGSLMGWVVLELAEAFTPGLLPINGLPIAALFVPALLANDMERSSVPEVLVGSTIAASFTLSTIVVIAGVVDATAIPAWAPFILLVSGVALFWPQLVRRPKVEPAAETEGDAESDTGEDVDDDPPGESADTAFPTETIDIPA